MPDITLPRRAPSLTTRRRSVAAPTAADVPTINPAVARVPGLDVPKGALGGEAVGAAIDLAVGVAGEVEKEIGRQKKLNEATNRAAIRQEALQAMRDDFDRREEADDFADPEVPRDFTGFVDERVALAQGDAPQRSAGRPGGYLLPLGKARRREGLQGRFRPVPHHRQAWDRECRGSGRDNSERKNST